MLPKLSDFYLNILIQADQLVTQKITGTEVTKFDDDFSKLEKASDIYIDLQVKPNFFNYFFCVKISTILFLCVLLMEQTVLVISRSLFVNIFFKYICVVLGRVG